MLLFEKFDFPWNSTSAFERYHMFFVYFRIASAPSTTKKYPVTWCILVKLKYNKTVSLIHITFLLHLWCNKMVYIIFMCNIHFVFRITFWTCPWCSYTRTCAEKCTLRDFSGKMKTFRLDSYPFIILIPDNSTLNGIENDGAQKMCQVWRIWSCFSNFSQFSRSKYSVNWAHSAKMFEDIDLG